MDLVKKTEFHEPYLTKKIISASGRPLIFGLPRFHTFIGILKIYEPASQIEIMKSEEERIAGVYNAVKNFFYLLLL